MRRGQKAGLTAHLAAIKAYNAGRRESGSVAEMPMRGKDNIRTAAEILVDQLQIHGVRHVFCVPGESYLAVLDAFHDSDLAVTVCRQEGGAAMMAEAVGKATGRPGVCFVTRGPGATNASPGIHIARQDSTPLVMFVGQVARDMRGREAFQEIDYRAMFGSMTKWATEIEDPARIPEIVSRAFYTAANGRPGPASMMRRHICRSRPRPGRRRWRSSRSFSAPRGRRC
jgi:acetolactate synthase-1/2/3 large subunit